MGTRYIVSAQLVARGRCRNPIRLTKKLAAKMKEARKAKRLSRASLAQLCGLSERTVEAIEWRTYRNVGRDTLIAISKAVGTDLCA